MRPSRLVRLVSFVLLPLDLEGLRLVKRRFNSGWFLDDDEWLLLRES